MKQYLIVDIEQSTTQSDGEVLIVKANEGKQPPGFEHLERMTRRKYFSFTMDECDETEVFVLPFSEELVQKLVQLASRYEEGEYWTPNMDEFDDDVLRTPKGLIPIHKSIAFERRDFHNKDQAYILPISDRQFKHKVVGGIEIVSFAATKAYVQDTSEGGFSWDVGEMSFFVFPDNEESMEELNNVAELDPNEKQFWVPDTLDFYHARIVVNGPLGTTEHDLYISDALPEDIVLDNLQDALW